MKRTLQICTLLALLTVAFTAFAQDESWKRALDNNAVSPKNLVTNIATTPYSGVLVYNFTILVTTPLVDPVYCSVYVTMSGDSGGRSYNENAYGRATPISGGYAKCTVKVYYTWQVASAGTDTISGSYSISGNTAASSGTTSRGSSSNFLSIPLPASGATTTTNLSGRL